MNPARFGWPTNWRSTGRPNRRRRKWRSASLPRGVLFPTFALPCSTVMILPISPDLPRTHRTRRDLLRLAGNGFGAIALQWLLSRDARSAALNPLSPKPQNFPAGAKSVIFLYMVGGPSQIDLFDPKPELKKFDGKPLPASYGQVISQFTKGDTPLMSSPWEFKQHGESGA